MTEERKQELRQLLAEAKGNLKILFGYRGALSLSEEVYQKYLRRHWASYGVAFLSFWFPSLFTPYIENETTRLKLLNFIREELALLSDRDYVISVTYAIESRPSNTSRSSFLKVCSPHLFSVLVRLLEITIGRGIEAAISTLDRFSNPKGVHGLFRHIALLDGINVRAPVQIADGVRVIPLPSGEAPEELTQHLPGFLDYNSGRLPMSIDKAVLIIDCPGFSIFYKPCADPSSPPGMCPDDLPYDTPSFRFENHNAKFPNFNVNDFCNTFCQALSLAYNFPVQIVHKRWFCEEDKSFNETRDVIGMAGDLTYFKGYGITQRNSFEGDIEEAKDLYDILCKNSDIREKLRIPIDRWIKAKTQKKIIGAITDENPPDAMIDLGIALEAFYVTHRDKITKQLCHRASWYLGGTNEEKRKVLETEFEAIYAYRSDIVHNKELKEEVGVREPFVSASELIVRAQCLCRKSIMKVLDDRKFPNWNTLRRDVKNR